MDPKVYIILLNWNGWQDTLECIDSLLALHYANVQIVVVDNHSDDRSVEHLTQRLGAHRRVGFEVYQETDLDHPVSTDTVEGSATVPLVIIENEVNHGFGRGNNVGSRFALKRGDAGYVWLLNNDTVVDPGALSALVRELRGDPNMGMVGSVIRYYNRRGVIQALGGGRFYPLFGRARLALRGKEIGSLDLSRRGDYRRAFNYLMGASLLIGCDLIEEIGLFDDDYFVYAEDVDLSRRIVRRGRTLGVAFDSFVFHKDSASTKGRPDLFFHLFSKSTIICLRKNYSKAYVPFAAFFCALFALRDGRKLSCLRACLAGMREGFKADFVDMT